MLKNYEGLLPSGVFLKLCGITYETLYHYEAIGLLRPTLVKPNGRRYYAFNLFYVFIVIQTLKRAHCSLLEIKSYLKSSSIIDNRNFLQKKRDDLEEEFRQIKRAKQGIEDAIQAVNLVLAREMNVPQLVECDEEYLTVVPYRFSPEQPPTRDELNRRMRECIMQLEKESEQLADSERYLPGVIFLKETLQKGLFHESYCFRRRKSPSDEGHLWTKPAGKYLSLICECSIRQDTYTKIQDFLDYIRKHSLEMTGPAYLRILSFQYHDETWNNFIMEIQASVAPFANACSSLLR